ncbi:metallophosphoesterase [Achromobacter insolitus]|uniref:metallophosphoesterase family protein n=1 Tax=Achromobacter insolitus TaxID=217204 RepID=UPI00244EA24D|nr:metallophosphoesterase [Achromobacter insolitus]MDH3062304.1 metallophosphoesterase [Achromobacter insolitus]
MNKGDNILVRLLVVSDIHAFSDRAKKSTGSVVDLSGAEDGTSNPLDALVADAKQMNIHPDLLVCAGDICNQADFGGLERAWKRLHRLRGELGAASVLATCGNHDLDSRFIIEQDDPDPKGALLSLDPPFPLEEESQCNKFWARNYAIVPGPNGVVIVLLNSCAFHGGAQTEIDHGRVSQRTIDELAKDLIPTRGARAHILVCHHHPIQLEGWQNRVDNEFMQRGQVLLDRLCAATHSPWFVIHGHRHSPKLIHGSSPTNDTPFVFGAASLGARVAGVSNQFHVIDLHSSDAPDHAPVVGRIQTWSWTDTSGWSTLRDAASMPNLCGFGYRGQIKTLAKKIRDLVGDDYLSWDRLVVELPAVELLIPDSQVQLENELTGLGINFLRDRLGRCVQVGR